MFFAWIKGVLARRPARLAGAMAGIAVTVALLASIGNFISSAAAGMTARAVDGVPVDWQVQLSRVADINDVTSAVGQVTKYSALQRVSFADVQGFRCTTGNSVQTTGAGKVVGIGPEYRNQFPAEIRQLTGSGQGVLVAQQTSANLHVKIGDPVTIMRSGLPPAEVRVGGIVDLPAADSLFQAVGMPPGSAPQAPPDNVLIMPGELWHQLFDAQETVRPGSVRTQLHVKVNRSLPADPARAYEYVTRLANNLEVRTAGSVTVGNNLAVRLDGVRADALYARVLFLFLGLPGVASAMALTFTVCLSGAARRRREQALLRTRGAPAGLALSLEALEAVIIAASGALLGVALSLPARSMIDAGALPVPAVGWTVGAAVTGFVLAVLIQLYPAWLQSRRETVAAARLVVGATAVPLWQRTYLDIILLAASAFEFWRTYSTGYQLVLAPEGVAGTAVHYEFFIAPLCLWAGGLLFFMRLWRAGLERGRYPLARLLAPLSGELAGLVAAFLGRQRMLITRGVILVALAVSFAVSTAVFNTTYNAQSLVDAQLTNGADVTISGTTSSPAQTKLAELRSLPGVTAAEPMQHCFAYVGNDLQDLYGIEPLLIGRATAMSNAYFQGGSARAVLSALARQQDGVLVSEETVRDFQLQPGDRLNLRLQNALDHQYHEVPFHFVGVVREFPTAPKDSFLVANASYIARQTGIGAAETVLLRTSGDPVAVASRARQVAGSLPGVRITDINSTQKIISSSLTAVDLRGLTRLELVFAVLLGSMSTGLILALGLAERRRVFAVLAALGAKSRQLGAFMWGEGLTILVGGGATGFILGFGIAEMLVKVLTGAFDPPPEHLSVPWGYLALLVAAAAASTLVAVNVVRKVAGHKVLEELRNIY